MIALVLVLGGLNACKKEILPESVQDTKTGNMIASDREGENLIDTLTTFSLPNAPDLMNKRRAIAYAFSKELHANVAFRNFMYDQLKPNGYRFKEIVIGLFKQKTFENTTIEGIINQRLRELQFYAAEVNPLETILQNDKLLTIWLPHEFIHSMPEDVFTTAFPIVVDDTDEKNLFGAGMVAESSNPNSLFAFHVSEAKNYELLNMATGEYEDMNINFSDYHGFTIDECLAVKNHLDAIADYTYTPGLKLIDPVDDVYLIKESNCGEEPPVIEEDPEINSTPPLADYECHRASFELKVRGNFSKHSNHFVNMSLASLAALDLIESHPCNAWLQNGTRPFQFNWVYAVGGVIQDQPRNKVIPVYKTQLVRLESRWEKRWRLFWGTYYVRVLTGGRTLLTHQFESPIPVFSPTPSDNHWRPQSNGDMVKVDVKLAHFGACSNTSQTATSDSYKIGTSVKFGFPKLGTNVNGEVVGTFEETSSQTKTVTFQINATAVYDLGRTEFTYCQPYPTLTAPPPAVPDGRGGPSWVFTGSTGSVVMRMDAPWFD